MNGLRRQGSLNLIKCGGKELTDGKVEVNAWREQFRRTSAISLWARPAILSRSFGSEGEYAIS